MRRWRTWGLLLVGSFLGFFLGTVVMYTTVLAPRKRELARLGDEKATFTSADLNDMVGALLPDAKVFFEDLVTERVGRGRRVWCRVARTRISLPASQQDSFMSSLNNAFATDLRKRGVNTGSTQTRTDTASTGRVYFERVGYKTQGGQEGSIQAWGVSHGDELDLWITIQER